MQWQQLARTAQLTPPPKRPPGRRWRVLPVLGVVLLSVFVLFVADLGWTNYQMDRANERAERQADATLRTDGQHFSDALAAAAARGPVRLATFQPRKALIYASSSAGRYRYVRFSTGTLVAHQAWLLGASSSRTACFEDRFDATGATAPTHNEIDCGLMERDASLPVLSVRPFN